MADPASTVTLLALRVTPAPTQSPPTWAEAFVPCAISVEFPDNARLSTEFEPASVTPTGTAIIASSAAPGACWGDQLAAEFHAPPIPLAHVIRPPPNTPPCTSPK